MRRFFLRLSNILRSDRAERELAREIASHVTLLEDEYRRRGMTADRARIAARRALGGVEQTKELHRDARSFRWLEDARVDLKYSARALARNPGFTAIAALTLALGIGANAAIFSVVHAVLLRPLPFPDADRLVNIVEQVPAAESRNGRPSRSTRVTVAEMAEIRSNARTLSQTSFTSGPALVNLLGRGDAARLQGLNVSPGAFEMLAVRPLFGRLFGAAEAVAAPDLVIVLSFSTWQRHFGGDVAIVGQTVTLANSLGPQEPSKQYTVIGVTPEGFAFPDAQTQFWLPAPWTASAGGSLLARLADGASNAAAAAEVGETLRRMRKRGPGTTYDVVRIQDGMVGRVKSALLALTVSVGFVLLIACANVASLLLARTSAREREIAIRVALGAGRARLIRHLLTESLLLAVIGGVAGILLAAGGIELLRALATGLSRIDLGVDLPFPRLDEVRLDLTTVAFATSTSVATGLLFGSFPALRHSHPAPMDVIRDSAPSSGSLGRLRQNRIRSVLIVAEIAMAMMLLVGGGLLIRSFAKLASIDPGYEPRDVVTFQVALLPERYPGPQVRTFAEDFVARLRSVPGVRAAAYVRQLPMVALKETAWFRRTPELPKPPIAPEGSVDGRLVSRDYFSVMGIRVIAGRGFDDRDAAGRPRALVINETLARREFPGQNPLGVHVYAGPDAIPWEIVGVSRDVRQFGLDREPEPQVFADYRQWSSTDRVAFPLGPYFAVRANANAGSIIDSARTIVQQMDRDAGVFNVATMEQLVANRIARPRMYSVLLGIFAAVAAVLALIGVYGVVTYAVSQRTREIGVRLALGARRAQIMRLVLGQGLLLTIVGIAAGTAGAAALTRYLEGMLFGLTPLDASTFAGAAAMFAIVATLASYVPARRATKVDPLVALRSE
jgi:putative ABC transport system permease protein